MRLVSKSMLIAGGFLALGMLLSVTSTAEPPATQPSPYIGPLSLLPKEVLEKCGLGKLSQEELKQLNSAVIRLASAGQAAELSKKHLESEGWQEVEVLGRTTIRESTRDGSGTDVAIVRGLGIGRKYFGGVGLGRLARGATMANGFRRIEILDATGNSTSLRQVDGEE